MLYTKCILDSVDTEEDGLRISIMSRHTLNDGVTPDKRIVSGSYDVHLSVLAPSLKLIGAYYKESLAWGVFENRYLEEIRHPQKFSIVQVLSRLALATDVTLLCIEDCSDRCHRRLLAEECQRIMPELKVLHRS